MKAPAPLAARAARRERDAPTHAGAWAAGLARDGRGAVMVEFLAVFLPILTMFLSLVQLAFVYTGSLIVQHAAAKAVRVAAVAIYDNPAFYNGDEQGQISDRRMAPIREAVTIQVGTLGDPEGAQILLDQSSYTPNQMIHLTVEYDYKCNVPIGSLVACGLGGTRKLVGTASLPNHGAEFIY